MALAAEKMGAVFMDAPVSGGEQTTAAVSVPTQNLFLSLLSVSSFTLSPSLNAEIVERQLHSPSCSLLIGRPLWDGRGRENGLLHPSPPPPQQHNGFS